MCNLQKLDYDDLNQAIFEVFQLNSDSAIHLDGKAIRGTIKQSQSTKQTFTSIVTAYSEGKSIKSKAFINGSGKGEVNTVQELIKALNLENMVLTMDALHCQN
jgi:hypothetical protein